MYKTGPLTDVEVKKASYDVLLLCLKSMHLNAKCETIRKIRKLRKDLKVMHHTVREMDSRCHGYKRTYWTILRNSIIYLEKGK